ncbi:MAG: hypothetical protein ABS35_35380 [Kaistia sp. SCN 65-12]|nr:MAG: hypothetical protein ABS35_35380 [Kaistia sp. SCN 65-12]
MRQRLQDAANRHLLILRDEAGLRAFQAECAVLREELAITARIDGPADTVQALELGNLIAVGEMMALAALARPESRGSHYREDHPARDPALEHNVLLDRHAEGGFFRARLGDL